MTSRYRSRGRLFDSSSLLEENEVFRPVRDRLEETGSLDEVYLEKLQNIFSGSLYVGVPREPTMVISHVYLGTQANAENLDTLRKYRITHVLNCAGLPETLLRSRAARYRGTGVTYEELAMDDSPDSPIIGFFGRACSFIDQARLSGQRVLIHCTGVSRSGAVAMAYLMHAGKKLLESARALKTDRRVALCHEGFMLQLVQYGRAIGALDPEPAAVRAPRYGRQLDLYRIRRAHLPDYLAIKW